MPIYQYACAACGHRMEVLQKMSDPRLTDCPACKKSTLSKQLTAAAFRLKGTGWYETDFKNSGDKPSDKTGDNNGDKAADKMDDKSGDTKGSASKNAKTESANTSSSSSSSSNSSSN